MRIENEATLESFDIFSEKEKPVLAKAGILTIGDVVKTGYNELWCIQNVGPSLMRKLRALLIIGERQELEEEKAKDDVRYIKSAVDAVKERLDLQKENKGKEYLDGRKHSIDLIQKALLGRSSFIQESEPIAAQALLDFALELDQFKRE